MPIPTTIADLSTTANLNSPSGAESVGTNMDNYIRAHAAIIKQYSEDIANGTDQAKGSSLVGFIQSGTGASARTVQEKLRDSLSPKDFGGVGDGVADDTAAIQACSDAAVAGEIVNLSGHTWKISSKITAKAGVIYAGGKVVWSITTALRGAFMAADDSQFLGITFVGSGATGTLGVPLYQIAIDSGATSRGRVPARRVIVDSCSFSAMTVGVFVGGDSTDLVPDGWRVVNNHFSGIVGLAGESEGYGVLFSPASFGTITGNIFSNIKRHAIYLAGGASHNVVSDNVVDTVDNIGIQLNTASTQPESSYNIITSNRIRNITKSVAYGYRSSVGIGIYGKTSNSLVCDNILSDFLDTGIELDTSGAGAIIGTDNTVRGNVIANASYTDAGIRINNCSGELVIDNRIVAPNNTYGIVLTDSGAGYAATKHGRYTGNRIDTSGASGVAFRVARTAGVQPRIYGNVVSGFTAGNEIGDTGAVSALSDLFNHEGVGFYGTDADYTYLVGVAGSRNRRYVRCAATQTAARSIFLDKTNVPEGAFVQFHRTGGNTGGPWNLNIYDSTGGGASLLKGIAQNQWAAFAWNGAAWEHVSSGSL